MGGLGFHCKGILLGLFPNAMPISWVRLRNKTHVCTFHYLFHIHLGVILAWVLPLVYSRLLEVKFVNHIWKMLWKFFGTTLKYSSGFRPQIDG